MSIRCDDKANLQTILNICLLYVNGYFRILAKKSFLLEIKRLFGKFCIERNLSKCTNACTSTTLSFSLHMVVFSLFKKSLKQYPTTKHVKRLNAQVKHEALFAADGSAC